MLKLVIVTSLLLCFSSFAQIEELRDVISDPAVSRRCKALLKERADKIKVIQSNQSLILRNKKLQREVKPNQKTVRDRLEINLVQLKNSLRLSQIDIKSMEENIIRKGCPGIYL